MLNKKPQGNCANAVCSSLKWIFSYSKHHWRLKPKLQVIIFPVSWVKTVRALLVWLTECLNEWTENLHILTSQVSQNGTSLSQIFQTIQQAGLSLVLFLSLKEAKSTHSFAYSVQGKQVQRGHLATAEVTDPGFWALPKTCPWLSDLQQNKSTSNYKGNQLNSDTASPSIKPQCYSLPFSLVQTQIHWQPWLQRNEKESCQCQSPHHDERAVSVGRAALHLGLQSSPRLAVFRFHISASWARQPHAPSELGVTLTGGPDLHSFLGAADVAGLEANAICWTFFLTPCNKRSVMNRNEKWDIS